MRPHEKNRMLFTGCILFGLLLFVQYLGWGDSILLTAILAGIVSGTSVIIFPDPDRKT